jgi:isopenicillin N synthase-like dioxygenase
MADTTAIRAQRLDAERIPLVDFAPFLSGDSEGRRAVASEISRACRSIGFLYLKNHGIPQNKVDAIFAASKTFFALPIEARNTPGMLCTPSHNRGYMPLCARHYAGTGAPDLMEAFKFQQELPADDAHLRAQNRGHQTNRWPAGNGHFKMTSLDYFSEMTILSHHLLRAFSLALQIEEDTLLTFFNKPLTQISLLHYPAQAPTAPEDEYGIRPHADATAFTILAQDDVGGLQVKSGPGGWIEAPPIPGTFVINIGDMMARWTNDHFASTLHRVFNRSGRERYSVPFFGIPDFDATIACLPGCSSADDPAKYEPLKVGDFINHKNASDWTKKATA